MDWPRFKKRMMFLFNAKEDTLEELKPYFGVIKVSWVHIYIYIDELKILVL